MKIYEENRRWSRGGFLFGKPPGRLLFPRALGLQEQARSVTPFPEKVRKPVIAEAVRVEVATAVTPCAVMGSEALLLN